MSSLRGRDIERDRDLSDYRQQRDYDRNYDDRDRNRIQDREISLGTGTILGIFFALALLCAVFFGFGYSMGRKSAQPAVAGNLAPTSLFGGIKPSPGSPFGTPQSKPMSAPATQAPDQDGDSQQTPPPSSPPAEETSYSPKQKPVPARIASPSDAEGDTPPAIVTPATPISRPARTVPNLPLVTAAAAPEPALPQIAPNGTAMVQVAAVSHQEDADLLVSALKKRGYAVFIRQEAQDHLLHVQVGPFANKKDAEAMRQHLLADGYNAIVK